MSFESKKKMSYPYTKMQQADRQIKKQGNIYTHEALSSPGLSPVNVMTLHSGENPYLSTKYDEIVPYK